MRYSFSTVCLAMFILATSAMAQRVTGSIAGMVTDSQGLPVAGAAITVVNPATAARRDLASSADGSFLVPELPPATYQITITAAKFETYRTFFPVYVGLTATLDAKLELGETSTVVEVVSGIVTVDTTQATVQGTIMEREIDSVPLNGRNFLDLAALDPGVQVVDGGTFDPSKNQMAGVSIGGRSGRATRIQVDGVDITDEAVGTTVANVSNESIEEFTVSQSSLDSSTDVTSSGAVNIITKSGTNDIHGSGFLFWRDARFAADQRLVKTGDKPPFDREIYGGRVGGPFIRDRWFWHMEFEKSNRDSQVITNVPEFPAFTGAFSVPVDENMGSGRTDFVISSSWKAFYRFFHNDNVGVTGFGGRDLAAFSNLNSTNIHVGGVDFVGNHWTHAFRHSYLNFNNFIQPANAAAGTPQHLNSKGEPDPGGSVSLENVLLRIDNRLQDIGPDLLAPQKTFQDNRQTKYDGGVLFGSHSFRFGAEWNRIEQFAYGSVLGMAPRIRAVYNSTTRAIANQNLFGPGGDQNPLNFPNRQIVLGNGLGYFSEKPALGYPHGGTVNHRLAFYVHDTWKASRNLTLLFGLRYTFHTALSNHDLLRAPLMAQFDPTLSGYPRRDTNDYGPQAGFAWNMLGNNKWVLRAGMGIFYETNIWNNLIFDRVVNIPPGIGNDTPIISAGFPYLLHPATGAILFDFSTQCTGVPNPTTPNSCFNAPLGSVIPFAVQAQATLQHVSNELAKGWPQPGVPPLFDIIRDTGGSVLDTNYKSPYGIQMNVGLQHEIKPGLVLGVDYLRNRGVHFNLIRDRNRMGAADTLHVPTAISAIGSTWCGYFGTSGGSCTPPGNLSQAIDDVIRAGGSISDFANNGLGAGSGLDGFAFSGNNRNFRTMGIIEPQGLSLFQALQVRLTGEVFHHVLGIKSLFANVSYQLGRFESTGFDQDFLSTAGFNDRPTRFFGPAYADRTHQLGFSLLMDLPGGIAFSTVNRINTGFASSLFLPLTTGGADEIFYSDLDSDGVTGDPLAGVTPRGAFSRQVKADQINERIEQHNASFAGNLAPAAQALVDKGLFTEKQLKALGAVVTSVEPAPAGQVNNDSMIDTDIRISNRIKIKENLTIEPMVEIFNLFNIANYDVLSSSLYGAPGDPNGTTAALRPTRVGQGSGSFSPGVQRAFQFGIRLYF